MCRVQSINNQLNLIVGIANLSLGKKKLVKWNESISRNNFLDNFHFLNFQQNIQKQLREIDLFDFTSFLALDILKF